MTMLVTPSKEFPEMVGRTITAAYPNGHQICNQTAIKSSDYRGIVHVDVQQIVTVPAHSKNRGRPAAAGA